MDKQDREFEMLLNSRTVLPSRSGLSERIIEAARRTPQESKMLMPWQGFDLRAWMGSFSRNFVLPQPALALALVLILGVMVGTYVQNASPVSEEDMIFLYVENSFEVEDWL